MAAQKSPQWLQDTEVFLSLPAPPNPTLTELRSLRRDSAVLDIPMTKDVTK